MPVLSRLQLAASRVAVNDIRLIKSGSTSTGGGLARATPGAVAKRWCRQRMAACRAATFEAGVRLGRKEVPSAKP
jgi:hypothetical protein